MPSFLTKVFGRKKDGGDEYTGSRSSEGELLDGKFEDVSPSISPSVAHFPELQSNGSPRGRGAERSHPDSRLRTFFRSRSRPASPTRQHRKADELPSLPLNLFAQDAPTFDDSQLLLSDKVIGERRLTPVEVVGLVKACSQAINNRGVETLGIMNPHWYSASPDVQRRLISLFIHSLTTKSPLAGLPSFKSEINDTRSPHDVAAVLRWGLRHIQLQGSGLGRNEDWYQTFFDEERKAEYPPKAFSQTLAPLIPSEHLELLQEVLEIFSSLGAHAETNSTSGSKLSKIFGLWLLNAHRVESKDDWRSFYERWEVAGRQLEHVFFARIRDEAVENRVPTHLADLVRRYPFYQDSNSPITDLRLLPRSGFSTRVHDALLVRLDTELPSTRFQPKSKVHPLRLIAEALSTAVEDTEYSGLWKKIVDVSKAEGTGTSLSRIFSDETIRFLSLLPNDGAGDDKSPALSLLPLSPSSPRAKRLSFSLSEFTGEIKRTNSTQSKSTAASPSPLSPLTADADWSLFATSGFGNSPTLTPLTSALFSTSSDVERTSPPSRRPSGHSKHSSRAARKSVEFAPAIPSEDAKQTTFPSKIALLQIVQLDEAFIDFWSDALLDPIAADWPAFVVCRVKPTLVPELKFAPAEGQEKTLQWVVLEQGYTVKAPPPPPVSESVPSAAAEHNERPSSPQSVGKKRFSFWSPSRTGSIASSIGSTSRKTGKKPSVYERGQRVSEMGEVVEEDAGGASASGAPLTSIRSAASTIGGGRTRRFRTPAAEDVVRVRIPSPRRKSTDVKSLDATVTSKKSTETPTEGTSAAAKEKEDKVVVEEPVAEKAEETKPAVEEKAVKEKVAAPVEDIPAPAIVKESEVAAVAEKKPVEESAPVAEASPSKAEVVEQEGISTRALPAEDVPALVEEVVVATPKAQPAPVVEEEKPVPVEEKKEPMVEEKATPVVVEESAKVAESTPTPVKGPTNGSVSASEKAKEKEKEKAVTSPEPASVIPKGAVKSLLARFQGKKDKKEKAAPSPAPAEKKKAVAPPPVPVKEKAEEKVEEKKIEEGSSSPSGTTPAAAVPAVAGVAAGVAVAVKKGENEEDVVEKAAIAPVSPAEPEAEPTSVVETKPAEVKEEVTKPAEVQEEETKPVEAENKEPAAVAETTAEDIPIPEESQEIPKAEEATAREVPAPEEPSEAAKEEESVPVEETAVAAEAPVAVEEEEAPAAVVAEPETPVVLVPAEEAVTEAVAEPESEVPPAVVVVQATPEDEEVPAAGVEDDVAPVVEVTEVETVPEDVAEKEIDVSPAAAEEEASEPTPEVVKDEEPIEETKPVTVEEKEASAPAEEPAVEEAADPVVPVEEAPAPIEEAAEAAAIKEPAVPVVVEEEATVVPAEEEEVAEGAVETPVDEEISVTAEAPEADVEEKEDVVVESTPTPPEVVAEEVPADVETKEEPTEVEAAEDAPTQDEDVATAVQATIPVVEEPEKTVEASAEPAVETVPVAGEGSESSTEAKEVVDPVETTAAQNGSAPSVSLDTPVLDTQDRSVSEAPAEVEDTTKQDQPEATTDPLVESHTVVNPDNQPPHDADSTKEPLANTAGAAEREAEEPQGEDETIQEAAESSIELQSTDEDTAVVEIKATSPEPHVVPATEEPIIEVPTESGDEIVTVDGDPHDIGQVAEISEAPIQVDGAEDSEFREETAPVEEVSVETEKTDAPESLSALDAAAASDDGDLPANRDTASQVSDSEEAVVTATTESAPAPEDGTMEAESTLEAEDSTLESQPQEDVAAEHDEDSTNKAAESEPIESEPSSEPVSVPPVSTSTNSTVAEAEDTPKDEAVVGTPKDIEGVAPAADEDPDVAVIAATPVGAESHTEEEDVPKDLIQEPSFAAEVDKHGDGVESAAPEQTIKAQYGSATVATGAEDETPEKVDVSPESGALEDVKSIEHSTDSARFGDAEADGNADEEPRKPELEGPKDDGTAEDSSEDVPVEGGERADEGEGSGQEELKVDVESEKAAEDGAAEEPTEPRVEDAQTSEEVATIPEVPVVVEEEALVASEEEVPATEMTPREAEESIPTPSMGEATGTTNDDEPHVSAFESVVVEEDDEILPSAEETGSAEPHTEPEPVPAPEATGETPQEEEVVRVEEAVEQQPVKPDVSILPRDQESPILASDDDQARSIPQIEREAPTVIEEVPKPQALVSEQNLGADDATEAEKLSAEPPSSAQARGAGEEEATPGATELGGPAEPHIVVDEKQTVENALVTETTSVVEEPSAEQTDLVKLDETGPTQETAAPNESDVPSVLSSVPHMEPLNTKDDEPSNEFVELPPVPLAEAPFIAVAVSKHALVPVADLNDDSLDSHRHHATATALPPAIEHTLDVGSTPSAEALLDAVQGHEGHGRTPVKISPTDKLTVDVEDLRSSPTDSTDAVAEKAISSDPFISKTLSNEDAELQAIPVIRTEDAPDDETKHVPTPLDLRLAETLAVAQDLPSAIEQAAVAGLTPEALLDAVQATLSATVFAPEPAAPTNSAQNADGKEGQVNEAPSAPILNGNGHHHVPDSEVSLAAEEPKGLPIATTIAEETTQPTEADVDLEKPVEPLGTEELTPPIETQDAATTIVEEKTTAPTSGLAESTTASEEGATEEEVGGPAAEGETSVEEADVISKPEVDLKTEDEPLPTAEEPAPPTAESKDDVALLESGPKVDFAEDAPLVEEEDAGAIVSKPQEGTTIEDKSLPSAEEPVESKQAVDLPVSEGSADVVGEDEPSTSVVVEQEKAEAAAPTAELDPAAAATAEPEHSTVSVSSEVDSNPAKSPLVVEGKDADSSVVEGEENMKPTTGTAENVASSIAGAA